MKVVDSARMAEIDRRAQEQFSIPQAVLMEDAGLGMYAYLRDRIWGRKAPGEAVVFLVGKGNNGGDALVMARQCRFAGLERLAIVLGAGEPEPGSLPARHLKICRELKIQVLDYSRESRKANGLIQGARWLIDGLLGTGLTGAARSPLAELIERANRASATRVAVDIPSGVGDAYRQGYPAVQADYTLTVELPKLCLYLPLARSYCGQILVVPGVFPAQLGRSADIPGEMITVELKAKLLRPLPPEVHKGHRGHLAVLAGSEGTTGAAWLCANAAARSRAGLVTVLVDRELYAGSIAKFNSVMVSPLEQNQLDLSRFDALLIGPGWGLGEQRERLLERLIAAGLHGVLDADGVTLLARLRAKRKVRLGGRWILTPHPGEFSRVAGIGTSELLENPLAAARSAAAELQAIVVLKGHCTYVVSPDGRYGILDGMNPALATGGSGDVLAGMIAGLLTSGCDPEQAARLAVLLHSEIGRKLYESRGYFLAEDMLPLVSLECKDI
jgi:hydroxyethylthiazole kinase-like uncharacterized protein yjeF